MYLKRIEIHGFKSFANKIVLQFNNGITTIVGPNGSGKSNVADAVRWVLGEQSAKQLRGAKMEDVIFAGTETRKPLGFAFVSITLDNSDHKLPIEYDEVTVARRVYRSGESEYLINGNSCRLKDVQELFFDTGIGKEGYSIIGQGQIDKILSGKPEERRELFDEAAGIVKYKKRKAVAERNLEEERLNLSRVTDIISEIEKQIGPLGEQAETAKKYLGYRDNLKKSEINLFLLDYDRNAGEKKSIDEKLEIAANELRQKKESLEDTVRQFEELENKLEECNVNLEDFKKEHTNLQLLISNNEGEVKLMNEKIASIHSNDAHYKSRMDVIEKEKGEKSEELEKYTNEKKIADEETDKLKQSLDAALGDLEQVQKRIVDYSSEIDEAKKSYIDSLQNDTVIKGNIQRYEAISETNGIKKAELNQRIIQYKSEENEYEEIVNNCRTELTKVNEKIEGLKSRIEADNKRSFELSTSIEALRKEYERIQRDYLSEKSKIDSLKNITERYEGYGNSIKKVMEQKNFIPGILGVVADIIHVGKKYETAIETALGGSIQNIVTKDEVTAKRLIEFLKRNQFGRATFLPLTSVTGKSQSNSSDILKENGVIGFASDLVTADSQFSGLVLNLLGRIVVVDDMDNALLLAKKYNYTLRIVTIEGEQLMPGGSISGGAYKNSSNLLSRRREIEEGENSVRKMSERMNEITASREKMSKEYEQLRKELEKQNGTIHEYYIEQNTAKLRLEQEEGRLAAATVSFSDINSAIAEIDEQEENIKNNLKKWNDELNGNIGLRAECDRRVAELGQLLDNERRLEQYSTENISSLKSELSVKKNNSEHLQDGIRRVNGEISKLSDEKKNIESEIAQEKDRLEEQEEKINIAKENIAKWKNELVQASAKMDELVSAKENISAKHKNFFMVRENTSAEINELDKEVIRLESQKEKVTEALNSQMNYIWDEYELTIASAYEYKDETIVPERYSALKKSVADIKNNIRLLGDVNVNAIEEYKNVSERFELMSRQKNDIINAEEALVKIIGELDEQMRRQFAEKFAEIKEQFDHVFKELFGGGKGTLELIEDEDILEAGIRIIAQPPGKKLQNMMQLSGGEKALTAIALLFAIQNLKPSPFCLLDEIEAALDDSNVKRYATYLHKLTKHTQFIVITHRRGTMAAADILYGITMQEKGVSTLVSVNLIENELDYEAKTAGKR